MFRSVCGMTSIIGYMRWIARKSGRSLAYIVLVCLFLHGTLVLVGITRSKQSSPGAIQRNKIFLELDGYDIGHRNLSIDNEHTNETTESDSAKMYRKGLYGSEYLPTVAKPLSDNERNAQNDFFHKYFANMSKFQTFWYVAEPDITKMAADQNVVIFVQSSHAHEEKRMRIRQTWGDASNYGSNSSRPFVFFNTALVNGDDAILEALDVEIKSYKDILLLNIEDSYDNLTFKSLLTMEWILHKINRYVKYVIKTDDDVMLNTFRFMSLVESNIFHKTPKFIIGFVWQTPKVKREGRYAVSMDEYAGEYYPAFCSGSGYVMSRDAVTTILNVTSRVQFLKRDDPLITGVLAAVGHVARYTVAREMNVLYDAEFEGNKSWERTLVVHDPPDPLWHKIWKTHVAYSNQEMRFNVQTNVTYVTSDELSEYGIKKIAQIRVKIRKERENRERKNKKIHAKPT